MTASPGSRNDEQQPEGEDAERADLLEALARHRGFLLHTVKGITDEEAARRTTVSELCLGGLVKHVAYVEVRWADFIVRGPDALAGTDPAAMENHTRSFRMLPGETLDVLLQEYAAVADGTGELVRGLSSLDVSHPLPAAPWFPPGARWSARRVLLHIVAETAQHAGHADIIREALDGSKTMG